MADNEKNLECILDGLDALRTGLAIFDENDELVFHNSQFQYVFMTLQDADILNGMTFEEILCQLVTEHEFAGSEVIEDPNQWIEKRMNIHKLDRSITLERLADGRWVEVKERRTRNNRVVVQWGDITDDYKRRLCFEDSVESAADGFAVWDQADRLALCNSPFASRLSTADYQVATGAKADEMLYHLAKSDKMNLDTTPDKWVQEAMSTRSAPNSSIEVEFVDGRHFLMRGQRARDGSHVTTLTDITTLKENERKLLFRGQTLQRALDDADMTSSVLETQGKNLVHLAEDLDQAKRQVEEEKARANRFAREALASENHLTAILETIGDALITINHRGMIETINPAAEEMFGYVGSHLLGKSINIIMDAGEGKAHDGYLHRYASTGKKHILGQVRELEAIRASGEVFPIELTVTDVRDEQDQPIYISVIRDITDRKAAERKIKHLANHDDLTGLPSLRLSQDRLDNAITLAKRHKGRAAALFIDLDGFKAINDTYGHEAGDYLLTTIAQRMCECARESDTIGRIGGDEFLVILQDLDDLSAASKVAQKILDTAEQSVDYKGHDLQVGISIGVAIYPDHGTTPAVLLRRADKAMYKVKHAGKHAFALWSSDLEEN